MRRETTRRVGMARGVPHLVRAGRNAERDVQEPAGMEPNERQDAARQKDQLAHDAKQRRRHAERELVPRVRCMSSKRRRRRGEPALCAPPFPCCVRPCAFANLSLLTIASSLAGTFVSAVRLRCRTSKYACRPTIQGRQVRVRRVRKHHGAPMGPCESRRDNTDLEGCA